MKRLIQKIARAFTIVLAGLLIITSLTGRSAMIRQSRPRQRLSSNRPGLLLPAHSRSW
jgi:hypothetical protein